MALELRNTALLLGTLFLTSAIMACSDGTTSSSTTGGSSSSSSSGGGTGACPANTICLDVKLLQEPVTAGRLAVVWFQLSDDGPDPVPLVAYDVPFDPAVKRIEIPVASITIPDEENLLCPRACNDEAMCPCTGEPKLGTGFVFVSKDADGNGKLDPAEVEPSMGGPAGVGFMGLGYSAMPYATVPTPYDTLFPEGIDQGVRPYRIIETNVTFDKLGKANEGDVFDLNVCGDPANATCMLPFPNLT